MHEDKIVMSENLKAYSQNAYAHGKQGLNN